MTEKSTITSDIINQIVAGSSITSVSLGASTFQLALKDPNGVDTITLEVSGTGLAYKLV